MRVLPAALAGMLLLTSAAPVAGCDFGCFDAGSTSSRVTQPIRRAAPAPTPRPAPRPASRPTPRPAPAPAPRPTPAPVRPETIAAQMGLHRVTQVWAGDVVTRSGPVTTYTSNTVQQSAGTYAKQVATVTTGQVSAYDAVLSNRRTTMTDGRAVSGDIYANYVWTGSSLALDKFVFFQDDREVARLAAPAPTPVRVAAPAPAPTPRPPAAPAQVTSPWTPAPAATARPASVVTPPPVPATPRPTPTPTPLRTVRAGIALAAQGDPLARIEVLRGRRVDLWPRATVDGVPGRVASWGLMSGEVTALGALRGTGDQPFGAMWQSLAPVGSSYSLRFTLTVAVPGEPDRRLDAVIEVAVRSPALVE
jgi:hypothetical protein